MTDDCARSASDAIAIGVERKCLSGEFVLGDVRAVEVRVVVKLEN